VKLTVVSTSGKEAVTAYLPEKRRRRPRSVDSMKLSSKERTRQLGAKEPEISDDPGAAHLQKVGPDFPKTMAERTSSRAIASFLDAALTAEKSPFLPPADE
jgi:hypothetical protein